MPRSPGRLLIMGQVSAMDNQIIRRRRHHIQFYNITFYNLYGGVCGKMRHGLQQPCPGTGHQ